MGLSPTSASCWARSLPKFLSLPLPLPLVKKKKKSAERKVIEEEGDWQKKKKKKTSAGWYKEIFVFMTKIIVYSSDHWRFWLLNHGGIQVSDLTILKLLEWGPSICTIMLSSVILIYIKVWESHRQKQCFAKYKPHGDLVSKQILHSRPLEWGPRMY